MHITAFIPARGGSESIPYKNMAKINGTPMLGYVIQAAYSCSHLSKIIVSSDEDSILRYARDWRMFTYDKRIHLSERPDNLSDGKTYNIATIVREELERNKVKTDAVLLLQPTSPFVKGIQINKAISCIEKPEINSVQTVVPIPHNYHWVNQRRFIDPNNPSNYCRFLFMDEREDQWNKQKKEGTYAFGNLVITKYEALKEDTFFVTPSIGIPIDRWSSLDVDAEDDLTLARLYKEKGLV